MNPFAAKRRQQALDARHHSRPLAAGTAASDEILGSARRSLDETARPVGHD